MPGLLRRLRESTRLAVHRAGFDIVRAEFPARFVPTLQSHGIRAVLDVGANTGQFGAELRAAGFRGDILSVEPLAAPFAALSARIADDERWTARRVAVSDTRGTVTLNVSENSVSSSVLAIRDEQLSVEPRARVVGVEEVTATTVDDIVADAGLDPRTLLVKLDVQGYEATALAGAAAVLPDVAGVRAELSLVPLYEHQSLFTDIVELLRGHGLHPWWFERGVVDPQTQRMLQLDGVFYR